MYEGLNMSPDFVPRFIDGLMQATDPNHEPLFGKNDRNVDPRLRRRIERNPANSLLVLHLDANEVIYDRQEFPYTRPTEF